MREYFGKDFNAVSFDEGFFKTSLLVTNAPGNLVHRDSELREQLAILRNEDLLEFLKDSLAGNRPLNHSELVLVR